jgi:hypothetical protein
MDAPGVDSIARHSKPSGRRWLKHCFTALAKHEYLTEDSEAQQQGTLFDVANNWPRLGVSVGRHFATPFSDFILQLLI